jgi:integrase
MALAPLPRAPCKGTVFQWVRIPPGHCRSSRKQSEQSWRQLIGLHRVSAAVHMNVEDVYVQGKRTWVRLHEKGGKEHTLPCHHELEVYLDAYMTAAGVDGEKGAPLFRTALGKTGKITARRFDRQSAWYMVKRRALEAGILSPIGCHTFRATGITAYLLNNGSLEKAQMMAAHESPRTTKLYDRTNDQISLDEVERILLT